MSAPEAVHRALTPAQVRKRLEAALAASVVISAPPLGTDAACIFGTMPSPGHVVRVGLPASVAFNANVFAR